ncbi:MAG: hypothetical protein LBC76_00450 [Treponema sp.]|jgi:hypothetical protein|nr:hypothetical protein [Treponema sp.]
MKKTVILTVFLSIAVISFAQEYELPNRNIFIEGTAEISSHKTYFMDNFKMEATGLGFKVVNSKEEAGYTFKFEAVRYEGDFMLLITLTLNDGDMELVSFGQPYSNLDEMYEYNQFVFYKAVVLIPGIDVDELNKLLEQERIDPRWRNKWVYFRATFDFPIAFHIVKKDGLWRDKAAYKGELNADNYPKDPFAFKTQYVDHKIFPMPGATVGIEIQPFNFLRFEVNFQIHYGTPDDKKDVKFMDRLNMVGGAAVKVPLKFFKSFDIVPYGAFLYPLKFSTQYAEFPKFFIGGGVEVDVKMGKKGALVFDVNYMFAFKDTVLKNPYGDVTPNPPVIHYNRFDLGLKVGYKVGFFNRK